MYKQLIDRGNWITFSKPVARALNSIEAALLLSEIINQLNYFETDEAFITNEHFESQILLTSHKVRKAAKLLVDSNLIEVNRKGIPAKNYYKLSSSFDASFEAILKQDVKKFNNCKSKNLTSINKNKNNENKSNYNRNNDIVETSPQNNPDNEFTDFRELIKQGKPIGRLGQAKAILQNELNLLTFSDHENKLLNDLLFKIRGDLRANNKLNKIDAKVTDDQILKAFETSVNHFKETNDPTKYSIAYLKSCINPNVFLRPDTDNLNDYKTIVKNTFAHYKNINRSELAKIESIKDKIKDYLSDNNLDSSETAILNQFKQLFQDLPEYITEKLSYQSIGYIESKTKELLLKIDYRNDERYIYLKNTFGEAKAKQIMNLN